MFTGVSKKSPNKLIPSAPPARERQCACSLRINTLLPRPNYGLWLLRLHRAAMTYCTMKHFHLSVSLCLSLASIAVSASVSMTLSFSLSLSVSLCLSLSLSLCLSVSSSLSFFLSYFLCFFLSFFISLSLCTSLSLSRSPPCVSVVPTLCGDPRLTAPSSHTRAGSGWTATLPSSLVGWVPGCLERVLGCCQGVR